MLSLASQSYSCHPIGFGNRSFLIPLRASLAYGSRSPFSFYVGTKKPSLRISLRRTIVQLELFWSYLNSSTSNAFATTGYIHKPASLCIACTDDTICNIHRIAVTVTNGPDSMFISKYACHRTNFLVAIPLGILFKVYL